MKHVLVVDDFDVNRTLPAAILRKAGCRVSEAASGADALERVSSEPDIAYVLLDVSMPGMSGLEVCSAIRARPGGDSLRIVAYTAHAFPSEREAIMAAGFDDLLVKPITRAQLVAALKID
jgi:CheY-like chemotaxis protein